MKPTFKSLILLFAFLSCAPVGLEKRAWIKVTFFDVGQGDAALLEFPDGGTLLVDAGPERGGLDTLLANRGIKSLDQVALSHAQADHYGGLFDIARAVTVGRLSLPPLTFSPPSSKYLSLVKLFADTLGIDTAVVIRGRTLIKNETAQVACLWPDTGKMVFDVSNSVNARAMVLRVQMGGASLLFTGDINFDTERELAGRNLLFAAQLLKVAHHGSKTSTSPAFLDAVRPKMSVISCGKGNTYGHPAPETLQRLTQGGGQIFRTDVSGTVQVWMNEEGNVAF